MKTKITIFVFCVVLFACKKDNIVLSGSITGCPINTTCSYSYYDNADFTQQLQPVNGEYRAFSYKNVNANLCGATTSLYFKSAVLNNEFVINASQITAGQVVAYDLVCPCCDYEASYRPIGGEIKGKRTDASHWLINASIIFGTSVTAPLDTLVVNQYFALTPVQ